MCTNNGFETRVMFRYVGVHTCVVAALKDSPSREHNPNPAATDRATSSTPARPTAP